MAFQVSPGVNVSEIDLTTVVPAVATSTGAVAGVFRWGPVGVRTLVSSELELVSKFGKPTNHNPETFFTAANFLAYGNSLYVVRAANTTDPTDGVVAAIANTGSVTNAQAFTVKNENVYDNISFSSDTDVLYVAKYPGSLGNSLKISVCDSVDAYSQSISIANNDANLASASISCSVGSNTLTVAVSNSATGTLLEANTRANTILNLLQVDDVLELGNNTIGKQYVRITNLGALQSNATARFFQINVDNVLQLAANYTANTVERRWEYFNVVDRAPATSAYQSEFGNSQVVDELHVVVADEDGAFTGVPGTVLEVFKSVSRATNAKSEDGAVNYYKDVINQASRYVWFANDRTGALSNTAVNLTNSTNRPLYLSFIAGQDGLDETAVPLASVLSAYDQFASSESVDISLLMTGKSRGGTNGEQIGNYLIDNIAEVRKDCVVFVSPEKNDVVANGSEDEADDIVTFRNSLRSSSYAVIDSGYKYQYDKYNDIFRWIPLNGDIAGLCVRTDATRDPWFSPAGFNRGQIKNVVKLAFNPDKAERDLLYKNGINPVTTFPGQGTVLYGDKTALAKPSAFDRINVRRLFITLEKAIATAAKFSLFEFNDEFTRAQFVALVEPFLRDVQGRRGIYDFRVVCDTTNNTGEVIDRNEFVGDIYVKPAKSINFIQLNFVAVRTGVEFSEVVGKF